ncbi:MAG: hypothetical protein NTX24_00445 [Candidatus Pacearchaeota archaeon]|nr:hypothetical protein [Candidatus Pacearchaeota archaeon]
MGVEACLSSARAFEEIDDEDDHDKEELYYLGLASTFSRTAVILADQKENRYQLDERQKRVLERCVEIIEDIHKAAVFIEDSFKNIGELFMTNLKPYRMFLKTFGRRNPPLMCVEGATRTMTSTLNDLIKYSDSPKTKLMQQTYDLMMEMSHYCLSKSSSWP